MKTPPKPSATGATTRCPADRDSVAWRIRETSPAQGERMVFLLCLELNAEGPGNSRFKKRSSQILQQAVARFLSFERGSQQP